MGITFEEWVKRQQIRQIKQKKKKKKNKRNKRNKRIHNKKLLQSPYSYITWDSGKTWHYGKSQNYDKTVKKINSLKKHIQQIEKKAYQKLRIDLRSLEDVSPEAMLLFYANIWRLKGKQPEILYPKSDKIKQVLAQIEFGKNIFGKKININRTREDVIHWKFSTDNEVRMEKYKELVESYYINRSNTPLHNTEEEKEVGNSLYRAMTEGLDNVMFHAYKKSTNEEEENIKRWWCFSQLKDKKLFLVICDLGMGIPVTIKVKHKAWYKNLIEKYISSVKDGDLLKNILQEPRSSTGEIFRGRGLKRLLQIADIEDSFVHIHSNYGSIFAEKKVGQEKLDILKKNRRRSINGTIILISIPFKQ